METLTITILKPETKQALQELERSGGILISSAQSTDPFLDAVERLQQASSKLTPEEIQAEVDAVRAAHPLHKRAA